MLTCCFVYYISKAFSSAAKLISEMHCKDQDALSDLQLHAERTGADWACWEHLLGNGHVGHLLPQ